ncbi:MAG TPA: glycosyltransferase family 2 protein [Dongiaceae bacterium]|nr:glycosyltransferase family 2 protein [Dongiaceae bacterium]
MTSSSHSCSTSDVTKHKLSVVVPVYNEQENIPILYERLNATLRGLGRDYEIVLVNDGSRDGSLVALRRLAADHPEVKVLDLKRNSGQTAALMCGIDHSTGDIIIPIDADLQNDPADIPRLLEKLDEGYDVVSGWRRERKDAAIRRNFVSSVANRVISKISGVHLRDYGCSLKAYRRSVLEGVRLYGEMHRFVPIYASWMGAKITEIPVSHSPRIYGKSKYGLERIAKVILDLIVVKFLDRHLVKPIYVFGGFGLLSIAVSFLALIWAVYLKLVDGLSLIQTPLPLLSAMALLAGITAILLGLMSEILVRTYFESQDKRPYYVRERLNL